MIIEDANNPFPGCRPKLHPSLKKEQTQTFLGQTGIKYTFFLGDLHVRIC